MRLEGSSAIVTGGASGLGAAVVRGFRAAGANVGIVDLNQKAGSALAAETGAEYAHADVADAASAEAAISSLAKVQGPARVLVNCAGIAPAGKVVGRDGPHDLALFEKVIRVNLIGTFNMLRLAAAHMVSLDPIKGERGVVVMTASVAAMEGQIGQAAYAASKGGVAALTLPAARDLARDGVRVVSIAPGLFKTPMVEGLPDDVQQALGAGIPFPQRLGNPAEFAQLAAQIVENGYLNGEVIRLDGALRMPPR